MYHLVVENDSGGGLTFSQARKTMEACWLRLYRAQWGCSVAIPKRGGYLEVEIVAMEVVKAKNGLACKQDCRRRRKSSFVERSTVKRAFGQ